MTPCPVCTTPLPSASADCPTCAVRRRTGAAAPRTAVLVGVLGIGPASGCSLQQDLYGATVVHVDADGDGFFADIEDCDDSDPDIHPEAVETPGDGVDSNCDGFDDPLDDTGDAR